MKVVENATVKTPLTGFIQFYNSMMTRKKQISYFLKPPGNRFQLSL